MAAKPAVLSSFAVAASITAMTVGGGIAVGLSGGAAAPLLFYTVPLGLAIGAGTAVWVIEDYPMCSFDDYIPVDEWKTL